MNKELLLLSKNYLVLDCTDTSSDGKKRTLTVAEIANAFSKLGYALTKDSVELLESQSLETLKNFYNANIELLETASGKKFKKATVLFKDFPDSELSLEQQEMIQQLHYLSTYGAEALGIKNIPMYIPNIDSKNKTKKEKTVKLTFLRIISKKEAKEIVESYIYDVLEKPTAISNAEIDTLKTIINENRISIDPKITFSLDDESIFDKLETLFNENRISIDKPIEFSFKENMFVYLSIIYGFYDNVVKSKNRNEYMNIFLKYTNLSFIKTIPDYLRLYRFLSDHSVRMMNTKIKYRSISRFGRKWFLKKLDEICKNNIRAIDDFSRNYYDWIIVFEKLHPGEFKQFSNIYSVANNLRNNTYITFNSELVKAMEEKNIDAAVLLLKQKPGEFARNLNWLLSVSLGSKPKTESVINAFESIADKISVNVLIQLYNYFKNRNDLSENRIFVIKTETGSDKIYAVENNLRKLSLKTQSAVIKIIENAIAKIKNEPLGKVYLSENMKKYMLPSNDRNVSENLKALPKGSYYTIDLKPNQILRLFIFWKNRKDEDDREYRTDVDLSIIGMDETLSSVLEVSWRSYYKFKDDPFTFSGDVTNAPWPNGAAEFLDIDIEKFKKHPEYQQYRYLLMNINSYNGYNYDQFECFAGVMIRDENGKVNNLFKPDTVLTKFRLSSKSTEALAAIFDIKENKLILVDTTLPNKRSVSIAGESVNILSKYLEKYIKPSMSMYDLVNIEHKRFTLVNDKESADIVIDDCDDADIRPWDQEKFSKMFM